ncbi:MAG: hypothetical protein ACXW05_12205 [Gemmatirosa sp.]
MLAPIARLLVAVFDAARRSTPRIWLAAGVALTLAVAPAPAHAQLLKRIKQAAAEKAAEAAGRKVLGDESTKAAPAASSGATSGTQAAATPAAARSSGPATLEITGERVGLFLVAMEPAIAAAKEREAHAAAKQRYEQFGTCMTDVQMKNVQAAARGENVPSPTKAQQAEMERLSDRGGVLVQEMMAAQQRNDTAKMRLLTEESERNLFRVTMLATPAIAKACGTTPPPKPAELDEDRLRKMARPKPVEGMSATQFGRLRERIALHLIAPDKANDLTAEEKAAIVARRSELAFFAKAWKDGTLEWGMWGDVFSAWKDAK